MREWQIVTVACRCRSSSAAGFPTMLLRPITTASAPCELDAVLVEQLEDAERRSGHVRGRAGEKQPRIQRMDAVDVLHRIDRVDHAAFVESVRERQLDEDAVDRIVCVQLGDERRAAPLRSSTRAAAGRAPRSRPRASPCASAGCRPPRPGRRRRARSPGRSAPGTQPPRARPPRGSALRGPSRPSASHPWRVRITATALLASGDRAHRPTAATNRARPAALLRDRRLAPGRTARLQRRRRNRRPARRDRRQPDRDVRALDRRRPSRGRNHRYDGVPVSGASSS